MKIFIGMVNIASLFRDLSRGFSAHGVDTMIGAAAPSATIVDGEYDFCVEESLPKTLLQNPALSRSPKAQMYRNYFSQQLMERALDECDAFLFIWSSFMPAFEDLARIKAAGKQVMVYVAGSDFRWKAAAEQECQHYGFKSIYCKEIYPLSFILPALRNCEKYSDIILGGGGALQLGVRPTYRFSQPLDLDLIPCNESQREKNPVIVHAPSSPEFKGTKYIMAAFERLKAEGIPFQLKLVQNMPHPEALNTYAEADILMGQVLYPGGGKQEKEGLACGCVVLANMDSRSPHLVHAGDYPIVHADSQNVYEQLKEIILDYPRRAELAKLGRPSVEKHNDVKNICGTIVDILKIGSPLPNYKPTFFRNHFVPESPELLPLYNQSLEQVRDCDWYQREVESGERAGLLF